MNNLGSREGAKAQRTLNTREQIDQLPKLDISQPIYVAGKRVYLFVRMALGCLFLDGSDGPHLKNGASVLNPLHLPPASNYPEAMCAADVIRLHAAAASPLCAFAALREPHTPATTEAQRRFGAGDPRGAALSHAIRNGAQA